MATKIAIIGTGAVGSTIAYACIMRNICAEIMLLDINENKCQGEAMDLADTLSFSEVSKIKQATFKEAAQADIIIIAAGKPQKPGQARSELLDANKLIIKEITEKLQPIHPQAVVIMVTNPVDTLTLYAQSLIKLPKNQILGSGTLLDSQRLRNLLSQKLHVAEESVHIYLIGEHGQTAFAALSSAHVAGKPLSELIEKGEAEMLVETAKQKVFDIIARKGFTNYGVASCVAATCENIIFDQKRIMPTSCYIPDYGICMSIPAAIGARGVEQTFMPGLNHDEELLLKKTVAKLQEMKNELKKALK